MIDKKILKEFLRLKWNETKWICLIPLLLLYYYVAIPLSEKGLGAKLDGIDYIFALLVNILVIVSIAGIGAVVYALYLGMETFINWLESNWKQARLNVYGVRKVRAKSKSTVTRKSAMDAAEKLYPNKRRKK